MQEIEAYKRVSQNIRDELASQEAGVLILKDKLVPQLERESCVLASDELRELISLTRELREFIFNSLDTHILTIERMADHVLCRRAYNERQRKGASPAVIPGTVPKTLKTVIKNNDFSKKNFEAMSIEELMALLQKQQKGV